MCSFKKIGSTVVDNCLRKSARHSQNWQESILRIRKLILSCTLVVNFEGFFREGSKVLICEPS